MSEGHIEEYKTYKGYIIAPGIVMPSYDVYEYEVFENFGQYEEHSPVHTAESETEAEQWVDRQVEGSKQGNTSEGKPTWGGPAVPGQLVLDVGAGPSVDPRATHAVDLQAPMWLNKAPPPTSVDYYPHPVNLGGSRYFMWGREVRPYEPLPYEPNVFDGVVSYAALGVEFANEHAYEEVLRVLKPGGRVELGIPSEFEEKVSPALAALKQAGYEDPSSYQDQETWVVTGRKPASESVG